MEGKMILITGAAGHIGKRMARRFLREGLDFVGIDCADNFELPEYRFRKMDIRDRELGKFIEYNGVNSIIHLAFCTKPKMDPKLRDDIDLNGSKNLIDCAIQKGVRNFVFTSTGRVYGDKTRQGGTYDRDGNYLNPGEDDYAAHKVKVEELLQTIADEHHIRLAILRLGIVCWDGGGAGLGDMLKTASKNGRFFILAGRNPPVQLVHVDDVIEACYQAIGKQGIFDIVSEDTMTMYDMFAEAAKLGGVEPKCIRLPEKPVVFLVWLLWKLGLSPIPPLYMKMYGYDITRDAGKTAEVLSRPKYNIQGILKKIIAP
jgi:UDP-glucose 4-epimerase